MSQKSEPTVIGSLPHTRPQRRSEKRGARPEQEHAPAKQPAGSKRAAASKPTADKQPAPQRATYPPGLPDGTELVATAVKAAAELAEIGLTIGARALRIAVSRLPRP